MITRTLTLVLGIVFISGCFSESHLVTSEREDQAKRERAIAAMNNANSLDVFLQVEMDNWKLGRYSLGPNYISQKRRQWYIENKVGLSSQMKDVILAGKWQIGMNKTELLASIGLPERNNRTVFQDRVHEQLIYEIDVRVPRTTDIYFYFENDILTSWQD